MDIERTANLCSGYLKGFGSLEYIFKNLLLISFLDAYNVNVGILDVPEIP